MAIGLDFSKTAARPSHEAIESNTSATEDGKSEQRKINDLAMQMAKRGENRIKNNERQTHKIAFTK